MAVHTPLSADAISSLITPYQCGTLVHYKGLLNGIENTNYLVTVYNGTTQDDYVLTLFEQLPASQVMFYANLLTHLASAGLPVPLPLIQPTTESPLQHFNHKPVLLLRKLAGTHVAQASPEQCATLAAALAHQHLATQHITHVAQTHIRDAFQRPDADLPLDPIDHSLLMCELDAATGLLNHPSLPQGLIHGDLFRDNVLFDGPTLCGLLDYYSATMGHWLFDIAVTLNDWCVTPQRTLDQTLCTAFFTGYQTIRPLQKGEIALLPQFLKAAALRFWLSRLTKQHLTGSPQADSYVPRKDPNEFRDLLRHLSDPYHTDLLNHLQTTVLSQK